MPKTLNLTDEISKLFTKEQMLAFCEISVSEAGKAPLTGICKFSKPRPGASSLNYIGVLFVFDTPSKECWQHVDKLTQTLDGPALKACLKELDYSVASPTSNPSPDVYIKQVDCIFKKDFCPGQDFLLNELHPALSSVTGLPLGEVMWWESEEPEIQTAAAPSEPPSLFAELKHLIVGPWRGQ